MTNPSAAASNSSGSDTGSNRMSLDAAMNSAFDAAEASHTPEPAAPNPSEEAPDGQIPAPEDAPEGTEGQQTEATGDPAEPHPSETKPEKPAKAAPAPAPLKAWTPAERAAFEASPPEVQQAITRMVKNLEAGFTKKTQQLAQVRQQAEEINAAFEPRHLQFLQSKGVAPAQAVKDMLALHDFWANDPVGYVQHVMQVSGVTPQHLGFGQQQQVQEKQPTGDPQPEAEPEWVDPAVVALRQQFERHNQQIEQRNQTLERELAQLRGYLTNHQQQLVQKEITGAQSVIERFATELDDNGEPAHPHFDEVQAQMEYLLSADPDIKAMPPGPEKLQTAYDRAVWMNPETRAAMLERERRQERAILEAQRTRAAATAKPRAPIAATPAAVKPRDLDAIMRAAAGKAGVTF